MCCGRIEVKVTGKMTSKDNMSIFGIMDFKIGNSESQSFERRSTVNMTSVDSFGNRLRGDREMDIL